MEFKTAHISFRPLDTLAAKREIEASFAFSQHHGALDKSTETYQKNRLGYCWLGVKTEPFDGWLATSFIELRFPDRRYDDFIVYPVSSIIHEGEWLWFPVVLGSGLEPLRETYQD